jgi:hypothetical protein
MEYVMKHVILWYATGMEENVNAHQAALLNLENELMLHAQV